MAVKFNSIFVRWRRKNELEKYENKIRMIGFEEQNIVFFLGKTCIIDKKVDKFEAVLLDFKRRRRRKHISSIELCKIDGHTCEQDFLFI